MARGRQSSYARRHCDASQNQSNQRLKRQISHLSPLFLAFPLALSPFPCAFTLVELLVVITIIAILIALLLPAVQAAREAVCLTQCDNLKQIGLALHLYHDGRRQLPAGWRGYDTAGKPSARRSGLGWASCILPFVEKESVSDSWIHFDKPLTSRPRMRRSARFSSRCSAARRRLQPADVHVGARQAADKRPGERRVRPSQLFRRLRDAGRSYGRHRARRTATRKATALSITTAPLRSPTSPTG